MRNYILFILFLFTCIEAHSQSQDSVRYGFLPSFAYDSDNGIYVAMDVQRFNYGDGSLQPYQTFGKYSVSYTGNGAYTLSASRDHVRTFGTDKRTAADVYISQNYGNYFPGYTTEGDFSQERFDTTSYYQFNSFLLNVGTETRIPITEIIGLKRTDVKIGFRVVHEKPFDLEPTSFMHINRPTGWDGSTYSLLELAYLKEGRDNEFRPRNGYTFVLGLKSALPVISANMMGLIYSDVKFFHEISRKKEVPSLVFAQKVTLHHTLGDIPYWFAPSLGGSPSLRGFIYRRFVGNGSAQSSTELRSWLLKLPWLESQVGMSAFMDNGVVFNGSFGDIQGGTTFGFGGFMSIFSRDYILKYEMGFSEEGVGVYIGSGFAF